MNELRLPPAPPADDAVRARVLARVLDGLDQAPPGRGRHWLVPVAAAVAGVLVIGTAVLVSGGRGGSVPSAGSVDPSTTMTLLTSVPAPVVSLGESAGRCTDAAMTAPGTYPDPSSWTSRGGVGGVVAVVGGAESVFEVSPGVLCRTTPTSVYLSAPQRSTDSAAALVGLGDASAGVVGPSGTAVSADLGDGRAVTVTTLTGGGSTFALAVPADVDPSRVSLTITVPGRAPRTTAFGAAEPGLTVVDRPTPPQERNSADGVLLDRCLTTPDPSQTPTLGPLGTTVPDPAAFRALPRLTLSDGTVAVPTRAPGTGALCISYGTRVALKAVSAVAPVMGGVLVNSDSVLDDTLGGAHVAVLSVDPATSTVEVTPGPDAPVTCALHDRVAYCLYRAGGGPTVFTARAAGGAVIGTATP